MPYPKRPKLDETDMDEQERRFHDSYKPRWGPGSVLLYSKPDQISRSKSQTSHPAGALLEQRGSISSEDREIAMMKLVPQPNVRTHVSVIAIFFKANSNL